MKLLDLLTTTELTQDAAVSSYGISEAAFYTAIIFWAPPRILKT